MYKQKKVKKKYPVLNSLKVKYCQIIIYLGKIGKKKKRRTMFFFFLNESG